MPLAPEAQVAIINNSPLIINAIGAAIIAIAGFVAGWFTPPPRQRPRTRKLPLPPKDCL